MTSKVKGRSLMIRVGGHTIALSTSCNIDISLQTVDARTKIDAGAMEVPDFISYTISSESVVGMNNDAIQQTQETLMELMIGKQPVDVEFMLAANAAYGVPAVDWQPGPMARKGFRSYAGKALIKQLSLKGALDGYATMTVQLSGRGALTPLEEPEVKSYVEGSTLYINGAAEVSRDGLILDEANINNNTLEI